MEALSDTSKNNLLQLENTEEYRNKLTDLCYEVIKRDERLRASLIPNINVANYVSDGKDDLSRCDGFCFTCGKYGHKARFCKSKGKKYRPIGKKDLDKDKEPNRKGKFDMNRVKLKKTATEIASQVFNW